MLGPPCTGTRQSSVSGTQALSQLIQDRISHVQKLAEGENQVIHRDGKRYILVDGHEYQLTDDNFVLMYGKKSVENFFNSLLITIGKSPNTKRCDVYQ